MTATKKRQLKRRYKTLTWLGYLSILVFALTLTSIIIIRKHSTADWNTPGIILTTLTLLAIPIISGIIIPIYINAARSELLQYKLNIRAYRARMFLCNAIKLLQAGEIELAIKEYRKCNYFPEQRLDDKTYAMLIMACHMSGNEKLVVHANRIDKLLEYYDPANVKL